MRRASLRIALPAALLGVLLAAGASPAASPESEEFRDASASRAEDSLVRARDSVVADSLRQAEAAAAKAKADSLLRGEPDLPNPALVEEVAADEAFLPSLSLLPTAPGPGRAGEGFEREAVSEALRLGAAQTRRYRVLSPEASARPYGRRSAVPEACFTPR